MVTEARRLRLRESAEAINKKASLVWQEFRNEERGLLDDIVTSCWGSDLTKVQKTVLRKSIRAKAFDMMEALD